MSMPLSSVSAEAAFFAFLSNVCFFSIVSMVLCSCLLRGFVGRHQRLRDKQQQQQQANGDAIDEDDATTSIRRGLVSHNSEYLKQLRQRKQQQQGTTASAIEKEEDENDRARSKAREDLASELEALKALQADVKSQLAMLQGIVATTPTPRTAKHLQSKKR